MRCSLTRKALRILLYNRKNGHIYQEWELQAYVVTQLHRLGYVFHGDQNAGKRGPQAAARAKATGMRAGWPDLQVLFPQGRMVFFEMKTSAGRLSPSQIAVHNELAGLGFVVHTVYAKTPEDAWRQVEELLG